MEGEHGLRATLTLPPWSQLATRDRLELDLSLGCPGKTDAGKAHVVMAVLCACLLPTQCWCVLGTFWVLR